MTTQRRDCPRCKGSGWTCEDHPLQPMNHDGCGGAGDPCGEPGCPFRGRPIDEKGGE